MIVLQVGFIAIVHAVPFLAARTAKKEEPMIKSQTQSPSKKKLFAISLSETIWTIATSVVAGALSALDIEPLVRAPTSYRVKLRFCH